MLALGVLAAATVFALPATAHAATTPLKHRGFHAGHTAVADHGAGTSRNKHASGHVRYAHGGGLSCVPFARAATGIALKGNAANWWDAAAGVYERGSRPELGSVLNFRATGHMRLGHVAVVTNVVGDREIEIDHANWSGPGASKGGVSRGVRVEDVSESNDWSSVRVALGHSGDWGSVYPTYGFIYDRPDGGGMIANVKAVPNPAADRAMLDEVAEAPLPRVIYPSSFPVDAPDHSVR